MKVKELLEKFNSGEIKYPDIMKEHNVSRDLIKARLKGIGVSWNNTAQQMEGEPSEEDLEKDVTDFLARQRGGGGNNSPKSASPKKKTEPKQRKTAPEAPQTSELDELDMILQGSKNKQKKTYRGFYWDNDILEALESISRGNDKSRIMNAAVRKIFKEKGIL